jgi:ABC-type uncharacterized transport system substrate-binding protein
MCALLALASVGTASADAVILINGNFEKCRKAGRAAAAALQSATGKASQTLEIRGGPEDEDALERLKAQKPLVVVATGVYAALSARKALPDAWIVYSLVLYPEVEGFTDDPKMIGISGLGSEKELFTLVNSLASVKILKVALIHSVVLDPSAGALLSRLAGAGFQVTDYPLSEAPLMEEVMRDVTTRFQAVLLLPDPITQNPSRLRFMITSCMDRGVLTLTTDLDLLHQGVLCGTFVSPERAGREAGATAAQLLTSGKTPPQKIVFPSDSETAVNLAAAKALKVGTGKPDLLVQ